MVRAKRIALLSQAWLAVRLSMSADSGGPVVVTGAGGFIGGMLVEAFAAAGRRHVALARQAPPAGAKAHPVTVLDLAAAPDAALDAIFAGAAAVVHLAGRAHVIDDRAPDAAALYHAANVVATQRIAAAAVRAGARRLVLASTIKVHGEATLPGRPFRSGDPLLPHDDYARSKADAERALASIAAGTGLDAVVLRLPLVYGPRVKGNFLTLLDAVARRARLPFGRITNRRDFLYVGNLVRAIEALLDAPGAAGGAWLAADGEAVSTAELARRLAAAVGVAPRVIDVPAPVLSLAALATGRGALLRRTVSSLEVDASPLAARIGPPPFTLDQGLAVTAAWWRMKHAI
jgi:nucleoside-diphosphate-sugar epimerase